MKYAKIGVGILCLLSFVLFGYGYYKNNKEQEALAKKAEILNKQAVVDRIKEEARLEAIRESLPQIASWGDSFTVGAGGNGINYPDILSEKLNLEVHNYGVGGEGAANIARRQGAIPFYISPTTIPAEVIPVEVTLVDHDGNSFTIAKQGDAGLNPLTIESVEGSLSYDEEKDKLFFTRTASGKAVQLTDKTQIITSAMKNKNDNEILIIYSGTNDQPDGNTISDVIAIQKKMIEYANTDNYIIVGLTSKDYMPDIENVNTVLGKEYGDKFLDFRKYLLENGLKDSRLTASSQDLEDIQNGEIPISLRSDNIHGNKHYYTLLGKQLENKIIELNYLSDDQLEVLGVTKQ